MVVGGSWEWEWGRWWLFLSLYSIVCLFGSKGKCFFYAKKGVVFLSVYGMKKVRNRKYYGKFGCSCCEGNGKDTLLLL